MAKAIFDELKNSTPKNHFTVGIHDDVTHTSLDYDPEFSTEDPGTVRALFYGLGSDGTVGANKNSIKIIGKNTDNYAQGYFVYDSKKAGSVTVSHLRFGPHPIRSSYLITRASFVACHQFQFLERMDVLDCAEPGATFLSERPVWSGRNLGPPAAVGAGNHYPEKAQVLSDRCLQGRARNRDGQPHQHHHADLFFCHQRSSAARAGNRSHKERHSRNLWETRRGRRRPRTLLRWTTP